MRPDDPANPYAEDAANAFIHLVVGGPANMRAWGVMREQAEVDRQTQFNVRLFLHGVLGEG